MTASNVSGRTNYMFAGFERRTPKRKGLCALTSDVRGTAATEFAFVALPLFALILAVFEISLTFFAQQNLETAAEKTIRSIMTGSVQRSGMDQAQFRVLVCSNLPRFMPCGNMMVDVRTATEFSTADTAMPTITYGSDGNPNNAWVFNPGGTGDIVVMRTMYSWGAVTGLMGFDLSNMLGKKRLLVATNVVKTEPY